PAAPPACPCSAGGEAARRAERAVDCAREREDRVPLGGVRHGEHLPNRVGRAIQAWPFEGSDKPCSGAVFVHAAAASRKNDTEHTETGRDAHVMTSFEKDEGR